MEARVKRRVKSSPRLRATAAARQTPRGARQNRKAQFGKQPKDGLFARPAVAVKRMTCGGLHFRVCRSRAMATLLPDKLSALPLF